MLRHYSSPYWIWFDYVLKKKKKRPFQLPGMFILKNIPPGEEREYQLMLFGGENMKRDKRKKRGKCKEIRRKDKR
jgi:hypothetical protein